MTSNYPSAEPVVPLTMETALPQPPPTEHIGSPTTSVTNSPGSSRPSSLSIDSPLRLKSTSVSQGWQRPNSSRHRHTASLLPATRPVPSESPPLEEAQDSTTDGTDFLTALAAQERRVLELKDELRRAEDGLTNLKIQWAAHESTKRRNESRRLHQMRPMSVSNPKTTTADDTDGSSAWMYEEMERKKALIGHTRTSSRRVFSGSRHAKSLSLIPPLREDAPLADLGQPVAGPGLDERSRVTPDLTARDRGHGRHSSIFGEGSDSPQREVFEQGKQLASEWKEGLWTFFEDLKQATVGDGPQTGPNTWHDFVKQNNPLDTSKARPSHARRGSRKIKPADDAKVIDVNEVSTSFWKDNGIEEPQGLGMPSMLKRAQSKQETPVKTVLKVKEYDGETWETWDSPVAKGHSPAHSSDASNAPSARSSSSQRSSPATSTDTTPRASLGPGGRPESIPWPVLTKLGPANLRRTASHLMDEWERSLTPPPEGDEAEHASLPAAKEVVEHDGMG